MAEERNVASQLAVDQNDVEEESVSQQYEKLANRAYTMLEWAKNSNDRRRAENRWADVQNFYLSKQWDGIKSFGIPGRSDESKRLHPCPVDNYFKAHIEGLVGDVTDRPPDIQIKPREANDEDVAQNIRHIVDTIWYRNKGDRKLEFIVRRGVMHGPLAAKVYWDGSWVGSPSNPFVGEVRFFGVLPSNIFVDPRVKAVEEGVIEQAAFVIYAVRRSLAYIRENYPENGWRVTADSYAGYVTTLTRDDAEQWGVHPDDTMALLVEFWYKGKPLAPEFPAREEQPTPREGWVHKAVVAGGVLLEHRTYVYPWYPFVLEWVYPSDESVYGYGDGYDMLIPQLVINKLNELSIEGAQIQSQGNWVTEEGNIRNKAQFQKYAQMGGSVLPVVDVQRTVRVAGGNIPSSLFAHYNQELRAMETVCGRYDVAQGRTPRNIQAASAIALLLQQAGGRVRQRARAVSSFLEQLVRKSVDLVGLYYTGERMVRVIGEEGKVSWKPVSRESLLRTKVWTDPLTGQQFEEQYIPEFDIIVTAGTDTPTSKAYYSELAMNLFRAGVIDEIALLDTLQFPRWREVLARKQAAQQAQAMAQQAAQQPPPPPVGAVGGATPIPPELAAIQQAGAVEANPYAQIGGGGNEIEQLAEMVRALQGGG